MRISHTPDDPPVTTPRRIDFHVDCGGRVHCTITRAALIFLAGHYLLPEDYAAIFETYRGHIENVARRKHEEGHERRYRLVLNAHDLVAYAHDLGVSNETPAPARALT
jgi:Protein of unknown function (DUF1488)